ncbi:MAG: hypothetical protein ACFFE4_01655 [Candidatus Thorarchaeota archaeon]
MVLKDNSSKITWKGNSKGSAILQIIEVLYRFSDHYEKKLNFGTLAAALRFNTTDVDDAIEIIMNFQYLFKTVFRDFHLKKRIEDNNIYLVTEPSSQLKQVPTKILMTQTHVKLLNDLIYVFKFLNRGRGFDTDSNNTELLQNVKELGDYYPYFFKKEDGKLYPTQLGLKLGELFLSYKKTNKPIKILELDNHLIRVIEDE